MVWWNEVSITPTLGKPGNALAQQNAVDISRDCAAERAECEREFVHYCLIDQNRFAVFFAAVGDAVARWL